MNYKGINLDDHKPLCSVGKLTNKVMNTLQNYYGMVIRVNEARHQYYSRGKDSW